MKKALMVAHVAYAIDMFNLPNIRLMQSMGYEVQVACNFDDTSSLSEQRIKKLKEKLTELGVKFYNIPFQRNPLKAENIKAFFMLKKLISKENFSLVHCHTPVGGILTRLACIKNRRSGTKVIYTAHGFHFFKGAKLVNWLIYFTAEWLCSFFTDILITINKEDFDNGEKLLHAKKVCYVPGVGVDTNYFGETQGKRQELLSEIGAEENSTIILSVGELSDRKNHSVSIKAISELDNKNTQLVIAGRGEKEAELVALAKQLKVENRVHLLGFRNDIAQLMKSADIFLFPSLQEGLPVALMEAMACSLPTVCSKIRGNVDLVDGTNGILCEKNDVNCYKKAIDKLTADKSLRDSMAEKAFEKSKEYDIKIIEEYMKDIYSF